MKHLLFTFFLFTLLLPPFVYAETIVVNPTLPSTPSITTTSPKLEQPVPAPAPTPTSAPAPIAVPTQPHVKDSDGDGFADDVELFNGFDPFSTSTVPLSKTIKVSIKEQRLRYYTGTYLVKEIKVSTGLPGTPTPRGTFTVDKKIPAVHYVGEGYDFPNTKWNMRFKFHKGGSYYVHGAYWHNKFGRPMSHGCVNVAYKDVETLYNWAPLGTPVLIQ